jgi:hypothetical protein
MERSLSRYELLVLQNGLTARRWAERSNEPRSVSRTTPTMTQLLRPATLLLAHMLLDKMTKIEGAT